MNKGRTISAGAGLSLATLGVPVPAQADDIPVTNLNDSGGGSLRAAIDDANLDPDSDRILFKSKLSGELVLESNLPPILSPTEVVGPGARRVTIDGNDLRVFLIQNDSGVDAGISSLTITGGHAFPIFGSGGAIAVTGGDFTLSESTLVDNQADFRGGGVAAFSDSSLTIESSTISGNTAGNEGGGVYVVGADFTIRNTTISGNSADGYGGGISHHNTYGFDIEVLNSTVVYNHAGERGGGLYENTGGATLRGTIVAGNTATAQPDFADLDDGPWPAAFSLVGDVGDATVVDKGGNLLNVDPNLKPLKNNGGPTNTHTFKKSPVKNKIPKGETPRKDQRGAPRKGKGDIGAYELVKCEGVIVNRVGTAKKDKLKGTKKKDGILGLGGNDKLSGKKGRDGLCGGRGKDKLKGGPGKDRLDGGPGKDKEIQ